MDKEKAREFIAAAMEFRTAAFRLSERWYSEIGDAATPVALYPFKESFDETILAIDEWIAALQEVI